MYKTLGLPSDTREINETAKCDGKKVKEPSVVCTLVILAIKSLKQEDQEMPSLDEEWDTVSKSYIKWDWKDDSAGESTLCSRRGPVISSQHPRSDL